MGETKQTQLNAFVKGGVRVSERGKKKKRRGADGEEIEEEGEADVDAQFDAEVGLATAEHAEHAEPADGEPAAGWVATLPTTTATPTTTTTTAPAAANPWKKLR